MVPNMPVPMVTILMVVISMFSLAKKENNNLCYMHNKNIYGDYYSNHLFCQFLQFCEAFKQLAKAAFFQNVKLSHIFKREKLMLRKDPLHC